MTKISPGRLSSGGDSSVLDTGVFRHLVVLIMFLLELLFYHHVLDLHKSRDISAPDRHLLATSETGQDSWLWLLQPSPDGPTRLIWRMRNGPYAWTSPFITLQLATDLGDFIFVRNILLSIKERVEGRPIGSLAASTAMVMVWLFAFVEFLGALVVFIARRDWLRPLAAIAATAATTLVLVFTMPPLWVDLLAVVALTGGLVWLRSHLVAP
jgi:hypothetical protein